MAEIKLNLENFEREVINSDVPVLVDFWATWCGPCRMIAPIIEEIAEEKTGEIKVGKVNIDEEPEIANAFNISSIPTLLVFRNGQITATKIGYCQKEEILAILG